MKDHEAFCLRVQFTVVWSLGQWESVLNNIAPGRVGCAGSGLLLHLLVYVRGCIRVRWVGYDCWCGGGSTSTVGARRRRRVFTVRGIRALSTNVFNTAFVMTRKTIIALHVYYQTSRFSRGKISRW